MQYSTFSGVVTWSQGMAVLRKGDSIDDDHPLLEERPDLFSETEPGARISPRIESGMQRLGEHRMERGGPRVVPAPARKPSDGE